MTYPVAVFRNSLTDFDQFRTQIQGVGLELIPLRSGAFWCRTEALVGSDFSFTVGGFSSDHRYRGVSHESHVLLGIHFGKGGHAHFGTNDALPGDLSVLQPRQEQFGSMGGIFEYAALTIARSELERLGIADGLMSDDRLLTRNGHIRPPAAIAAAVCAALERAREVAFLPQSSSTAARTQLLKRTLLYPYLLVAAHGQSKPDGFASEPKAMIVRRAEDWLDGEPPERLHVIDLCLALGLPLRTVQRAFQETVGMGPARYLTYYRLHKVRQLLKSCDPTTTKVTDVALDHGFWELGRFAGLYRRTYGERPSDTLRRRQPMRLAS